MEEAKKKIRSFRFIATSNQQPAAKTYNQRPSTKQAAQPFNQLPKDSIQPEQ